MFENCSKAKVSEVGEVRGDDGFFLFLLNPFGQVFGVLKVCMLVFMEAVMSFVLTYIGVSKGLLQSIGRTG